GGPRPARRRPADGRGPRSPGRRAGGASSSHRLPARAQPPAPCPRRRAVPAALTGRERLPGVVSVLAVVDSDSYLKWACSTLDALDDGTGGISARSVVIVRSPLAPTPPQREAAVAGTAIAAAIRTGPGGLRRVVARHAPDVVLVGAAGP